MTILLCLVLCQLYYKDHYFSSIADIKKTKFTSCEMNTVSWFKCRQWIKRNMEGYVKSLCYINYVAMHHGGSLNAFMLTIFKNHWISIRHLGALRWKRDFTGTIIKRISLPTLRPSIRAKRGLFTFTCGRPWLISSCFYINFHLTLNWRCQWEDWSALCDGWGDSWIMAAVTLW